MVNKWQATGVSNIAKAFLSIVYLFLQERSAELAPQKNNGIPCFYLKHLSLFLPFISFLRSYKGFNSCTPLSLHPTAIFPHLPFFWFLPIDFSLHARYLSVFLCHLFYSLNTLHPIHSPPMAFSVKVIQQINFELYSTSCNLPSIQLPCSKLIFGNLFYRDCDFLEKFFLV